MILQIEKLKKEREKLVTEYKTNQTEYKSEIKRIDKAIRNFEKGVNELNGAVKPKRVKTSTEIEKILTEGPLHLKQLVEKLNARGIPMAYQSISGIMQLYAKSGKKFVKTAPATYALIEPIAQSDVQNSTEQTVVYKEMTAGGENGEL